MTDKDMAIKRNYVRYAYKGQAWRDKVDKMPNDQIVAIYYSLKGRRKKTKHRKEKCCQLSIFDCMGVKNNEKEIFNKLV